LWSLGFRLYHQDSLKEMSDIARKKSELEEAREAGKVTARRELG
jgi:seryl-tRNA(Sec) selenium transferase